MTSVEEQFLKKNVKNSENPSENAVGEQLMQTQVDDPDDFGFSAFYSDNFDPLSLPKQLEEDIQHFSASEDEEEESKYHEEISKSKYDFSSDFGQNLCGGVVKYSADLEDTREMSLFAVQEHNRTHGEQLTFERTVKANVQLIGGLLYFLTLEASDMNGSTGVYEATVLDGPPCQDIRKLEEFRLKVTKGIKRKQEDSELKDFCSGLEKISRP